MLYKLTVIRKKKNGLIKMIFYSYNVLYLIKISSIIHAE